MQLQLQDFRIPVSFCFRVPTVYVSMTPSGRFEACLSTRCVLTLKVLFIHAEVSQWEDMTVHEWTHAPWHAGLWCETYCSLLTVPLFPSTVFNAPLPPFSAPAAASQRWRQPLVVFRELATASPLPQPPPTHAHPAHISVWPTQEPGEVRGHMLTFAPSSD